MEGVVSMMRSFLPHQSLISRSLLIVLLVYSFSSQFLPIEPYLVPYFTSVKHFTNSQVTIDIFPYGVYAQLIFTLLMASACFYLSHKVVVVLGAFGMLISYLIIWCAQSLLAMQIVQITYGFGAATRLVFSSYIFLLVPEEEYQRMTSLTTTTSLLSFMLASELSQMLALMTFSYSIFLGLTLTSLGVCCVTAFLLPEDRPSSLIYSSVTSSWGQSEGWIRLLEETWKGRNLQILSLWWALAYAGFSLVQTYGTNLFDAIDSKSKFNGHVLAASQAVGSLGAICAVYLEQYTIKSGVVIYVIGSAAMCIVCLGMGLLAKIWVAYFLYVVISGIYQILTCLVSVHCGRLLSNRKFILLFSVNNFVGLLLETLLQAAVEISELSISTQYVCFAGFFLLATVIFIVLFFSDDDIDGRSKNDSSLTSNDETEPLILESRR
ncbi:thiamine transporter 1-like isoform X1 [Macadamia integrifolia]|uniref:thiamine transporter 1-like isoform X1 n=1 Tax=Macadamia integrifolia TaxID=60698 RepID=UPI001C52B8CD|nr:thiamine transporter 1-like isoform X1 [Macadamia integrifolia]